MTRENKLGILQAILASARERVSRGEERAQAIVTAVEEMILECEAEHEPAPRKQSNRPRR